MFLTKDIEDNNIIIHNGEPIHIDLSFSTVLKSFELEEDDLFTIEEKIYLWAQMFIINRDLKEFSSPSLYEIVKKIFILINKQSKKDNENDTKVLCFKQDAEYIYSSFMQAYSIDLQEEQGEMHWEKFLSLLKGLPDDTKFKEVVSIRLAKIPKQTKENKEEIKRLRELKEYYALKESKSEKEKRMNKLSDKLTAIGNKMAKK